MTSPPKPTVFAGRQDVACFFALSHMTGRNQEGRGDPQIPHVLDGPEVIPRAIQCDRESDPPVDFASEPLDRLVKGYDCEVTVKKLNLLDEVF